MMEKLTRPNDSHFPEVVPILDEDDICTHSLHSMSGQHCLAGWLMTTFSTTAGLWVLQEMREELLKGNAMSTGSIMVFNDAMSKKKSVEFWNKMMRKLGYNSVGTEDDVWVGKTPTLLKYLTQTQGA